MSNEELRLECMKLALAAKDGGQSGTLTEIFDQLWAKLSPPPC